MYLYKLNKSIKWLCLLFIWCHNIYDCVTSQSCLVVENSIRFRSLVPSSEYTKTLLLAGENNATTCKHNHFTSTDNADE